ncbi:MAG: ABC transporter permease, partial [Sphingobacteriaceae bacterium]|nr:ABC transporter permease [Cytophagaceae bacterium]
AGGNFDGTKADSAHVILNETAIKQAGIQNPIGKRFKLHQTDATIIGVVKDFKFVSDRIPVSPLIMFSYPEYNQMVQVRTTGQFAPAALAVAGRLWKQYSPEHPFEYTFLDETYNRQYRAEQQTGQLFNFFAGVAILVSCLGLLGLAAFTAEQRTKEIGVRKVLGASVFSIVALLSKDFLKLVAIAIVIASPLAWWAMTKWLENFAYKISIGWWVFALSGLLAVGIALLTVSFQSIRAALMNPVKSLKSE